MELHKMAVEAVAVIVEYDMKYHPLFQTTTYYLLTTLSRHQYDFLRLPHDTRYDPTTLADDPFHDPFTT